MPLTNLSELRSAIADFGTGRTDLTSQTIDNFITLAEHDIEHGTYTEGGGVVSPALRVRSMEAGVDLTLTGEFTNLPADYLQMREVSWVSVTNKPPLKYVTPEAFDSTFRSTSSGPAKVWTIVGSQLRVGPAASASDVLRITYYASLPPLVDHGTNWLMTNFPNVYLYGSLRHLAPYIGAMDFLPVWQSAFMSAAWSVIRSQNAGSFSGTSMAQVNTGISIT